MARARHHTSVRGLAAIRREGVIRPARGDPVGVHVEVEPFGSAIPGRGGPRAETGAAEDGAFVEFDLPENAVPTDVGPRRTAVIPTSGPLTLTGLRPRFVRVRRWWNLWYFWR
jgi:hypothetical protein